jgi:hypothetical protein
MPLSETKSMQTDQIVSRLGAMLRDVAKCSTDDPLPVEMAALLMMLEQAEEKQAKQSHNLPHWTSGREPQKHR